MPFYEVRLEGTGISLAMAGSDEPVVGFFTTRQVRAESEARAKQLALASVAAQWSAAPYAQNNKGSPPVLTVEKVWRVGWWHALFRQSKGGHTFYNNR